MVRSGDVERGGRFSSESMQELLASNKQSNKLMYVAIGLGVVICLQFLFANVAIFVFGLYTYSYHDDINDLIADGTITARNVARFSDQLFGGQHDMTQLRNGREPEQMSMADIIVRLMANLPVAERKAMMMMTKGDKLMTEVELKLHLLDRAAAIMAMTQVPITPAPAVQPEPEPEPDPYGLPELL